MKPIIQPPPTRQLRRFRDRQTIWSSLRRSQHRVEFKTYYRGHPDSRAVRRAQWARQCAATHSLDTDLTRGTPPIGDTHPIVIDSIRG